jgi:diguanylate cyclase (GGDEF)-like protein
MPRRPVLLHFSPHGYTVPPAIEAFAEQGGYRIENAAHVADVIARVNRSHPVAIVLDGSAPSDAALELCRHVKAETFTGVVPVVAYVNGCGCDLAAECLDAGADEVLTSSTPARELRLRLGLALRRAQRDVSVNPTTRLPGTGPIESEFAARIHSGDPFAVCYADLDHFKEFNDRYGYNQGDRVILITSRILRDVVRAHSPEGFIGHIGGDDFIFVVPLDAYEGCCADVIEIFDELIPLQYSEDDRARGHFMGKDRRGHEYRVPLMTISIGVVTNLRRGFTHPAQIGELATEMKTYAKTLSGSVYAVDRRGGDRA